MTVSDHFHQGLLPPKRSISMTTFLASIIQARVSNALSAVIPHSPELDIRSDQLEEDDSFEGILLVSLKAQQVSAVFCKVRKKKLEKDR